MPCLPIVEVTPGSIADLMEISPGDALLAVNGVSLRDIIDYSYYTAAEPELTLEIEKADGEIWELVIERQPGESLGLVFAPPNPARCSNNCIFCFVHQLPRGLRKPLYVKDEDYRLSFLNGNYVTLANLKPTALRRIVDQHLSPLYISVHSTSPALRETMLGKAGIPPVMDQLKLLAANRIAMHTQIVLCPGVNDGAELQRSVDDLASLYPAVRSLAIVPVGLTAHRSNLPSLAPVTADYAGFFLKEWQPRCAELRKTLGGEFLFLADEFYLKAQMRFPPLASYGDLPQLENGVGMVPLFMKQATGILRRVKPLGDFRVSVVTGSSALPVVAAFMRNLSARSGVDIAVVAVENRLFGESVTVTGLICGRDIISALCGSGDLGSCLLLPDVMLKEGEGLFLDGIKVADIEDALKIPVLLFDSTPGGFYRALSGFAKRVPT